MSAPSNADLVLIDTVASAALTSPRDTYHEEALDIQTRLVRFEQYGKLLLRQDP